MPKPFFLLAGIGVALSALLGYNAIYVPHEKQVRVSRAQLAEEQANQAMQAEVAALLAQVERYRARLPEEPDPAVLVRDVVELAQQSGVQLTTIARGAPEAAQGSGSTRLTVNLTGTASYHELGAFLDALERSERFLRVERFEISRAGNQDVSSVQVSVSTLFLPPPLPGGT